MDAAEQVVVSQITEKPTLKPTCKVNCYALLAKATTPLPPLCWLKKTSAGWIVLISWDTKNPPSPAGNSQ